MSKCDVRFFHVPHPTDMLGSASVRGKCLAHGVEFIPTPTDSSGLCHVGKGEAAARDALADVNAKLDLILATLAKIDRINE